MAFACFSFCHSPSPLLQKRQKSWSSRNNKICMFLLLLAPPTPLHLKRRKTWSSRNNTVCMFPLLLAAPLHLKSQKSWSSRYNTICMFLLLLAPPPPPPPHLKNQRVGVVRLTTFACQSSLSASNNLYIYPPTAADKRPGVFRLATLNICMFLLLQVTRPLPSPPPPPPTPSPRLFSLLTVEVVALKKIDEGIVFKQESCWRDTSLLLLVFCLFFCFCFSFLWETLITVITMNTFFCGKHWSLKTFFCGKDWSLNTSKWWNPTFLISGMCVKWRWGGGGGGGADLSAC